ELALRPRSVLFLLRRRRPPRHREGAARVLGGGASDRAPPRARAAPRRESGARTRRRRRPPRPAGPGAFPPPPPPPCRHRPGRCEAVRLKKLVYTLPPVLLHGHQLAVTDKGLLLVANEGVDVVPLGTLLSEVAPGLLIPVGMDLVPRVPTEVLAAAIEHELGE